MPSVKKLLLLWLVPSLPGDAAGPLRALHAAQEVIDQQTR